ncbi:MAG TPA: hypothetical protein VNO30_49000 [Kofleriaceae bacterium]|nr:hypothetical protein [Kofleriaceae bacterium]
MTNGRYRVVALLLVATLGAEPALATTYLSAEPIPTPDVVGAGSLAKLESIGYARLERWSRRLLDECRIVDQTIGVLAAHRAISTVDATNTSATVAAGGFEAVSHPSYVLTVRDTGPGAASAADLDVLANALGYVLNQDGTAYFTPDSANAYQFALDYAVITFAPSLSGESAKQFFDFVGTIDPALWSGLYAGFTQVGSSMFFLQPAVSKQQFIDGLAEAARVDPAAAYATLNNHGSPTTARAGVAFPENDWIAFPDGGQYLAQVGSLSPQLASALAGVRQRHLQALAGLVSAIDRNNVDNYLTRQFRCP